MAALGGVCASAGYVNIADTNVANAAIVSRRVIGFLPAVPLSNSIYAVG